MDQILADLAERLKGAFGERLVSVILYGSAAAGDWHKQRSDLNVLCVLNRISPEELGKSEPIFKWWREQGNPPPLLLTEREVGASTDCFPMEFHDMREHRRVLYGKDAISDLRVENVFYRAQVEHELRAKQIRLRQKAAEALSDAKRLQKLMTDSISTFCVLGRHVLMLGNSEPHWKKRQIVDALGMKLGQPLKAFGEILTVRETGKLPEGVSAVSLLERYLNETDALVNLVDALDK